ncbi:hypothetical protein MUY35_06245 [Aliiroseovarius sp. S1339]|uniref:hypothetical protein n=1 Tax=Aliiroseovarius sp. S1339 TaxID=2936990 RepID=UPI0020C0B913|nr:hypothetical protein [Aliiroseovarius sp. S1339]MCK8463447.1 hypothetical protein [Aliiroseovarius sp. S1339]
MPTSFATKPQCLILLAPFGYAFLSRYHWPRDFVVNALTAWVPGVILVALLGDLPVGAATMTYLLGYAAFICIYEVGYLANDTIGLRHDATPRRRVDHDPSFGFVLAFVVVRLGVVLAAAVGLSVAASGLFWAAIAALLAALVAHNTLRAVELKFYTFMQLSLFRFSLPVLPILIVKEDTVAILIVLATALLLFSLPRFLTYLDAKGRLSLPERKARSYHLKAYIAVLPLVALLSILTAEPAPMVCLLWAVLVQIIYVVRATAPRWRRQGAMQP